MCDLATSKTCDTCVEYIVHTDSGMDLEFTLDPRDKDNDIIKSWLFATEYVLSIDTRKVGDTAWSTFTYEEWSGETGLNL